MTDFQLGQRVIYTHPLTRVPTFDTVTRRSGRSWVHPSYAQHAEQQREGIIVGKRTLANGIIRREEWGNDFTATEHFQAYLIATAMNLKPVLVRVENVRRAPLQWRRLPDDAPIINGQEVRDMAANAWLEGAAAGASVDAGFIPSDVLTRPLPERLAEQFRTLNPYSPAQEN